jgi:lysophospholipase L1-like esterase
VNYRCHAVAWGLAFLLTSGSHAFAQEHWVATWAASPQSARLVLPPGLQAPPPPPSGGQTGQANRPPAFPPLLSPNNQTVRMIVHTSIGGSRARIQLSNAFGTTPLNVGAVHVALRDKGSAIAPTSDRALTFSGKAQVTIPPGAEIVSDAVDLNVPKLGDLVVSVYVPGEAKEPTSHLTGLHTTYISKPGDLSGAPAIADATTTESWYWLSGVDVLAPADAGLIVAFGDSITDGATSTADTDSSWPNRLAQRLLANKATTNLAIVNEGISGNRLLHDGMGISALARFDRDVLALPGVKWLIVMLGINDIGFGSLASSEAVTADDVIAAHKQLIDRAHLHGIRVMGATLTPFAGALYYSEGGEAIRQAVNQWIRTSKAYDAVIDFDMATRDPENARQIRSAYNIRDHLHPNDAGYKAMADAFNLSIFTSKSATSR